MVEVKLPEITLEMLNAGVKAFFNTDFDHLEDALSVIFRAMFGVMPKPSVPEVTQEMVQAGLEALTERDLYVGACHHHGLCSQTALISARIS